MTPPITYSIPKSKRILLGILGLATGALVALLALVFVLAHHSNGEAHWPVVRVFSDPGWVAIWSFAVLAIWLAWEGGLRVYLSRPPASGSLGPVAAVLRTFAIGFLVTGVVGGAVMTLVPSHPSDNLGGIKLVPMLPPAPPPEPLISYVVFFPNGSWEIPPSDRPPLRHFLHELSQCSGLTLRLTAFVSSAPYPTDDERRNSELLQHRLDAVSSVAKLEGLKKVDPHHWDSLQDMRSRRGFVDQSNSQRLERREAFNRRVEIRVSSYGECGDPGAPSSPPVSGHSTPGTPKDQQAERTLKNAK